MNRLYTQPLTFAYLFVKKLGHQPIVSLIIITLLGGGINVPFVTLFFRSINIPRGPAHTP